MAAGRLVRLGAAIAAVQATLLLSAWGRAKPNAPTPPTIRPCTATCPGPAFNPCQSKECQASMQPGWQCFKTGAPVGCIMNFTSTLNCTSVKLPIGDWARSCCDSGYKQCGSGCCQPRDGATCACGKRWNGVEPCCVSSAATQAQQNAARCCIVDKGVGVNCESPGQLEPCCLDKVSARDPDRYVVCQPKNCSSFVKCSFGIGYDCLGREGHPESRGKNRCCLNEGGPYPHDTCRANPTCNESGYKPCQETGVDCSSQHGEACCLEQLGDQGVCRRGSCDAYRREQDEQRREQDEQRREEEEQRRAFETRVSWLLGAAVAILLALAACPCLKCMRKCWTHFWGTAQSEEVRRVRQDIREANAVQLDVSLEAAHGTSQSMTLLLEDTGAVRGSTAAIQVSIEDMREHNAVQLDATLETAHGTSQSMTSLRQDAAKVRESTAAIQVSIEDGRQSVFLAADGLRTCSGPAVQFRTRVVYTIGCTESRGDGLVRLGNGNSSAEAIGQALKNDAGFDKWVHKPDATKADMDAGLKEAIQHAIQNVQGREPALLVIYYSGHGFEDDRGLWWLGTDAAPQDPKTHFSVREMQSRILDAGTRKSLARDYFECRRALGELYVVVLADNCRLAGEVLPKVYDGPSARTIFKGDMFKEQPHPRFLTVFGTGAGRRARDGNGFPVSPFARAFCELLPQYPNMTMRTFFDLVSSKVHTLTNGAQHCEQLLLLDHDLPWNACLGPLGRPASASVDSTATAASSAPSNSAAATAADASSFSSERTPS